MKPLPLPNQVELKRLLDYDPATGVLLWRVRTTNRVKVGDQAGTIMGIRRAIAINGKRYLTARIIWKWMTGNDPTNLIDHADNHSLNDTWSNLREATKPKNGANSKKRPLYAGRKTTASLKGVHRRSDRKGWLATITINYKTRYLGEYPTEQEAHDVYVAASRQLHGSFHRAK